jgi:thioesterase domain-containing protein/acyl carrier protein
MFFAVDALPRNTRGKVDRAALRQSAITTPVPEFDHVAPRTARELVIAELAAEAVGLPKVGVRDDLFDLGLDSLAWVGLLSAIDERFGVSLSLGDLLEAPTVETLARRYDAHGRAHDRIVMSTYTGGAGTPFFCVAGGGGAGLLSTRRLGRRLGRPVFSFTYRGAQSRAFPDRTLPNVAARFVRGMREAQPQGPYLLGGLSFGGLLAFEMARQLHADGQQVALLVLMDPAVPRRSRLMKSVQRLRDERTGRVQSRGPLARRTIRWVARGLVGRYLRATAGLVQRPPLSQSLSFYQLDGHMARRYVPQSYAGRTLLLRTEQWRRYDERDLSRSLSGQTHVEIIPGLHGTMFAETNLAVVSALIREEIAALGM